MNAIKRLVGMVFKTEKYEAMLEEMINRAKYLGIQFKYEVDMKQSGRFGIHADQNLETGMVTLEKLTIDIRPDLSALNQIVAIAHELGHAWQFLGECEGDPEEWFIYKEINNILVIESDAWYRSVLLLHEVGFGNWAYFIEFAVAAFSTYNTVYAEGRQDHIEKFRHELEHEIKKVEVRHALV